MAGISFDASLRRRRLSVDAAERPPQTEQPPFPGAFRAIEERNTRRRRGRRLATASSPGSEGGDGRLIVQASFGWRDSLSGVEDERWRVL